MEYIDLYHECPICGSLKGIELGKLEYTLLDNNPLSNEYRVTCCLICGFISYNVESTQENYDKFYENHFYSSDYIKRKIDINEENYIEHIIKTLSPYLKDKNIRIYDIGCGNGLLLKKLQNLGYKNIHGIDLSFSCIDMLNKEGIDSKNGSILNIPFDEKADIIILSHVLEHVIDLKNALKNIRNKLKDNGIVYVEVPDAFSYEKINFVSPMRYFYLQHVIHFDDFHLGDLFRNNGFTEMFYEYSIRNEGNLIMPCICGIFRKNDLIYKNVHKSHLLACKIVSWFKDIHSLDINNILISLLHDKKNIYIWGLGIHMSMMLSMSPLKDCKIKYYIDNDERNQKETINGYKIHSVDFLNNATENNVVIIGAPTHSEEMYNYLINTLKFKGEIIKIGFGNVERLK